MKHCCKKRSFLLAEGEYSVLYIPNLDEYGIRIQGSDSQLMQIKFCPWCGSALPRSKRTQWHQILERKGIDPDSDDVPPDMLTDAWWRKAANAKKARK